MAGSGLAAPLQGALCGRVPLRSTSSRWPAGTSTTTALDPPRDGDGVDSVGLDRCVYFSVFSFLGFCRWSCR